MTTEHMVVRSGKSKRKPFNSNVADLLANYRDLSRNFTRCRSAVLEVARFQSESFDCCLRKPAPRFDLLIRSHHCTDNCFVLLRILRITSSWASLRLHNLGLHDQPRTLGLVAP